MSVGTHPTLPMIVLKEGTIMVAMTEGGHHPQEIASSTTPEITLTTHLVDPDMKTMHYLQCLEGLLHLGRAIREVVTVLNLVSTIHLRIEVTRVLSEERHNGTRVPREETHVTIAHHHQEIRVLKVLTPP